MCIQVLENRLQTIKINLTEKNTESLGMQNCTSGLEYTALKEIGFSISEFDATKDHFVECTLLSLLPVKIQSEKYFNLTNK